jgi:hypothetical protein
MDQPQRDGDVKSRAGAGSTASAPAATEPAPPQQASGAPGVPRKARPVDKISKKLMRFFEVFDLMALLEARGVMQPTKQLQKFMLEALGEHQPEQSIKKHMFFDRFLHFVENEWRSFPQAQEPDVDKWKMTNILKILFRNGNLTLALAGWWQLLWARSGCGGSGWAPGWCGWAVASLLRRFCGGPFAGGRPSVFQHSPSLLVRWDDAWGCCGRRVTAWASSGRGLLQQACGFTTV